jgi:hypothetical protein
VSRINLGAAEIRFLRKYGKNVWEVARAHCANNEPRFLSAPNLALVQPRFDKVPSSPSRANSLEMNA